MSRLRSLGELARFLLFSLLAVLESIARALTPTRYKMKEVAGEIALVTGGGSGLGRLLSLRLAKLGAVVVVWDINAQGLEETLKLIKESGGTCYGYVCDLCDREDVYKKASLISKEIGRVSILVNNAGVVTAKNFLDSSDQMIIRTMEVNVMSHFWTVKAFLPAMLKENKGHIVTIASLAGHIGCSKLVDYTASKFAAVGFEEALSNELAADGYDIKTTVICPYFINSTGMFDEVISRFVPTLSPEQVADRVITALRCNEKYAIIPSYLQLLLMLKWMFPYKCSRMLLAMLVQEVSPTSSKWTTTNNAIKDATQTKIVSEESNKEQINGVVLHQQLARRVSSSERKP